MALYSTKIYASTMSNCLMHAPMQKLYQNMDSFGFGVICISSHEKIAEEVYYTV